MAALNTDTEGACIELRVISNELCRAIRKAQEDSVICMSVRVWYRKGQTD